MKRRLNYRAPAARAGKIAVNFPNTAKAQRLLSRQQLVAALLQQLIRFLIAYLGIVELQDRVQLHALRFADFHLHPTDGVDYVYQALKVYGHIRIHRYAKVFRQGFLQQFRAAPGIAGIDAVAPLPWNFDVHVPQKRDHLHRFLIRIQLHQHSGIAAPPAVIGVGIRADEQQVIGRADIQLALLRQHHEAVALLLFGHFLQQVFFGQLHQTIFLGRSNGLLAHGHGEAQEQRQADQHDLLFHQRLPHPL